MGIKISALPSIVTPDLSDVFPVVQSGVTYKESGAQLSSLFATAGANSNITSLTGLTTPLTVPQGGTGITSATPYAVIIGGTASTNPFQSVASVGNLGDVLTSNGAAMAPTFQPGGGGGGGVVTDWVAYTPTFTGFGSVSSVQIWSRRVGDTLCLRGKFTAGTSTTVEGRMTLGYNGTDSNITSSATKIVGIQVAGVGAVSASDPDSSVYMVLIETSTGFLTFGLQSAVSGGLVKVFGSTFLLTGETFSFTAEVPVDSFP